MSNKTENGNEAGPSGKNINTAGIIGNNNTNNTINYINYTNGSAEEPVNKTINWFGATSCFKGREETLAEIEEYFTTSNKMVVIYGGPGIGKTETARQFGNKKSEYFNRNLVWMSSETEENLKACFENLSKTMEPKVADDVSQVYSKFKSSGCLVVFDNAENMASIQKYLPNNGLHPKIKVLITSQLSEWDSTVVKVLLEPLKPEEALQIFEDKLEKKHFESHIESFKDLVEYLEGIPLSVQIVSSLIKKEFSKKVRIVKFNLQLFIKDLKDKFIIYALPISEIDNYRKTVFSSIIFALERLKKEKNTNHSLDLLHFMGYLDADRIYQENLLVFPLLEKSEEKLETALNILEQYSLIQIEYDNEEDLKIKIHRTIQHVLREYDLTEQNGSMFKTVLKITLLSGYEMYFHLASVCKYVKEEKFKEKSLKFYEENTTLADKYLIKLARYNCDGILFEFLPKFKEEYCRTDNDKYKKILNTILFEVLLSVNNNMSLINELINNYGAKIEISSDNEYNGFHLASSWLSIELFDLLLKTNDAANLINSRDETGQTILHYLVFECNEENVVKTIECMDHLISKWKADISIPNKYNDTILHTACLNIKICFQMIKYLVEKCNCRNLVNQQGKWYKFTPLQNLLIFNDSNSDLFEMVSYFLKECEADVTIEDEDKWNTLFYVCNYRTSEIIELVLKSRNCRQFINNQDKEGDVAFTLLIKNNLIREQEKIELMKLFIENGMECKIRNNENKTLVEIAEEKELLELSLELKKQL